MMREMATARKRLRIALFYLMLLVIVLFTVLPFLWMLSSSFKGSEAIRTIPIRWIPEHPTLEGYQRVFNMQGFSFARSSLNSLLLAIACTIVAVGSAAMAAFVFAKLPFKGSNKLFGLYLATMMIPGTVTMVPNYIILRKCLRRLPDAPKHDERQRRLYGICLFGWRFAVSYFLSNHAAHGDANTVYDGSVVLYGQLEQLPVAIDCPDFHGQADASGCIGQYERNV